MSEVLHMIISSSTCQVYGQFNVPTPAIVGPSQRCSQDTRTGHTLQPQLNQLQQPGLGPGGGWSRLHFNRCSPLLADERYGLYAGARMKVRVMVGGTSALHG